jgi:hypothetical protein
MFKFGVWANLIKRRPVRVDESSFGAWRCELDTVLELHAGDDLRQMLKAAQPSPTLLRCHPQLIDEGQHRLPCHAPFGTVRAVPDRRKRRLDHVG